MESKGTWKDREKAITVWDDLERELNKRTICYLNNSEQRWVDPFCIHEGLYYVGDKVVSSHLIDTGEGLILIDTGFPIPPAFW